jgi:repressor LexA
LTYGFCLDYIGKKLKEIMPPVIYYKQKEILEFIKQYIAANGSAPKLREIADAIGVSSLATVHEHLQALEKKGLIKRNPGGARGIELADYVPEPAQAVEVPVLGYVAAGQPIEPYHDPNATIDIPPSMFSSNRRIFTLRVRGNSMIEAGILDGDYVVLAQQNYAKDGDIIVGLLDNGMATLKRYFKEKTRIRLEPANQSMSPIYAKNVWIQGKVIGVIRRYS